MSTGDGLLVGIDGGTQSTKVLVFDRHGAVVAEAAAPLRPMAMPAKGHFEHPDDDLWTSLQSACSAAMEQLGQRRKDILGVGLCSIRFCRALLRADGTLAAPVMSWMDERVGRPHVEAPGVRFVTAASAYVTARLTGEVADSVANYAGIWPVDHDRWDWSRSDEAIATMGVSRDQLPRLVKPGDVLGEVTDAASRVTGLPAGVPVVATANDKAVEALGNGLLDVSQMLLSLGTYITAMRPADERRPDTGAHWSNFACQPHRYLDESAGIRRGMSTISWVRDLVSAELSERADQTGRRVEDIMNEEATRVPAGSEGLLTVLDWLAPTDQPHRRGAMVGFDARHGWPHMYRSVLEGIALTMRRNCDAMEEEFSEHPSAIIVAGGGSRSDVMMQIVADVFAVPARRARITDGAAVGSAISAAVGVGVYPDAEAAAHAMVHMDAPFLPNETNVPVYAALGAVHAALPGHLDQPLRQIHAQGL